MRVKVNQGPMASPWGTFQKGDQVDVPDEVGAIWVEGGFATEVPEEGPLPPLKPQPLPDEAPATNAKADPAPATGAKGAAASDDAEPTAATGRSGNTNRS